MLVAADCSVSVTTLPRRRAAGPDATVLWLDAHADFNTPETTVSGYLGGMCLAAACGVWDAGLSTACPSLDPTAVVTCGLRDVEGPESRPAGDPRRHAHRPPRPARRRARAAARSSSTSTSTSSTPRIMPSPFPAPGGLSDGGLRTLLTEVADAADLVGCEITGFHDPRSSR